MAISTRRNEMPDSVAGFEPLFEFSTALTTNLMQLQRLQLEAWLSWQRSVAAGSQEFLDEWACRFAGGAPIDG